MNRSFDQAQRQESLKRRWQERRAVSPNMNCTTTTNTGVLVNNPNNNRLQAFPGLDDDDLVSTVVPPVTVVLEGRSICQRISLHKHASYQSLAKALRQMFVEGGEAAAINSEQDLDLSNAVPGHLIAYEDMENDLLLAGDLNWKDFVRVAKRIRILPVKGNSRKGPTRVA
ncbi:auxin-responsive protein IAA33 [Citrus sinensis]|uniref:Auxin-responsive protein IAA33 n=1 Tax=Citrus sinensis TaxID=2711 RepID=A0ACB8P6D5_CITSI|nr:auxin-responsive protein IAA33 [Citrus sinensis]